MLLNSPNHSKWIPIPELALIYIALCLWWGLLNRLSALKWSLHREVIVPMTCHAYDVCDGIVGIVVTAKFITTMWFILARETIVVVIQPPKYGGFATA